MMECGQYNELWHEIHMMPEESVKASLDLNASKMLPIHNSAFSLSTHSWDEPLKRAYAEAGKLEVEIIKVKAGESFIL
jgi:L-ascorbate metabolism protein UlaG (beta-lactamase superfamily)